MLQFWGMSLETKHPIVLYDGICGLCNRSVQFLLRHDRGDVFRFASLQSDLAHRILQRHGFNAGDLDTVYVVLNPDQGERESLLARSDAAAYLLMQLSGIWRVLGRALQLLPRAMSDWGYRALAGNRYRLFGRYDGCPLPSEATRKRFLDL